MSPRATSDLSTSSAQLPVPIGLESADPQRRQAWTEALGPLVEAQRVELVEVVPSQPMPEALRILISDRPLAPTSSASNHHDLAAETALDAATVIAIAPRDEGAIRLVSPTRVELQLACELLLTHLALRNAQTRAALREQELITLARRDPLTGLPNRLAWNEELARRWEQVRTRREPLGLILLDLNHFKRINDLFGIRTGDQRLAEVAQRLAAAAQSNEFLARIGGDEFGMLLPGATAAEVEGRAAAIPRQITPAGWPTSAAPSRSTAEACSHELAATAGWSHTTGWRDGGSTAEELTPNSLFDQADTMLRQKKRN